MIGQNIGAGNKRRAQEILNTAVLLGAGAAFAFAVTAYVLAPLIVEAFTTDATVTVYTLQYFRIVPFGYAFFAMTFIVASTFQGLGHSWPGFWITVGRVGTMLILANVFVAKLSLPIWSVWLAIALGGVLASIAGLIWIRLVVAHLRVPEESQNRETA